MIRTAIWSLYTGHKKFALSRSDAALWWLSVFHARQHFAQVELMADARGAELLAALGIAFDRVRIGFPEMPDYAREIPTQGKLYALRELARESTAAVHLDHDVILWQPLPARLLGAQCCMQSAYALNAEYERLYAELVLPPRWMRSPRRGYNSGILGSADPARLREWAEDAVGALNHPDNARHIYYVDYFIARCLVEETSQHGYFERITPLFETQPHEEDFVAAGYTHLAGNMKRLPEIAARLERRMTAEHPEAWERIVALTVANP